MGSLGMLNMSNIPRDQAGYGSHIWVRDVTKGADLEYRLVTSEEAQDKTRDANQFRRA